MESIVHIQPAEAEMFSSEILCSNHTGLTRTKEPLKKPEQFITTIQPHRRTTSTQREACSIISIIHIRTGQPVMTGPLQDRRKWLLETDWRDIYADKCRRQSPNGQQRRVHWPAPRPRLSASDRPSKGLRRKHVTSNKKGNIIRRIDTGFSVNGRALVIWGQNPPRAGFGLFRAYCLDLIWYFPIWCVQLSGQPYAEWYSEEHCTWGYSLWRLRAGWIKIRTSIKPSPFGKALLSDQVGTTTDDDICT